jgi:hypothetical protein
MILAHQSREATDGGRRDRLSFLRTDERTHAVKEGMNERGGSPK